MIIALGYQERLTTPTQKKKKKQNKTKRKEKCVTIKNY